MYTAETSSMRTKGQFTLLRVSYYSTTPVKRATQPAVTKIAELLKKIILNVQWKGV